MNIADPKTRVATLSVASNTILVLFKAIIGILIGSVSVLSEAIHSGMDLVAAIIALFAVKLSGKSPDEEHAFGHGKVESISAAVEALLIFVAAIWIIYEAVHKLISPQPIEQIGWGILIMLVSSVANLFVSQMLFRVGNKTESAALIADGWHLRTDVYTSAGVMGGLGLIWLLGYLMPGVNVYWLDPAIGIIVALMITRAAFRLTVHAVKDLMDSSTPPLEKAWIRQYMSGLNPTIHSYHKLRTRKVGPRRFIDCHIVVDPNMTVQESHDIEERITEDFRRRFPNCDITLHAEPCDGACTAICISGCMLPDEERLKIRSAKVTE